MPQDEDVEFVFEQPGETSQRTRPCQLGTYGQRRIIPGLMRVPLRRVPWAKALRKPRRPKQLTGLGERAGATQPLREGVPVTVVEPRGTWPFENNSGIERRGHDRSTRMYERGARHPQCVRDAHQLGDPEPSLARLERLERLDPRSVHVRQRRERRHVEASLIAPGADAPTEVEQAWQGYSHSASSYARSWPLATAGWASLWPAPVLDSSHVWATLGPRSLREIAVILANHSRRAGARAPWTAWRLEAGLRIARARKLDLEADFADADPSEPPRSYVIDMDHTIQALDPDAVVPEPARRFAEYVGSVVLAASAAPRGRATTTKLPCRHCSEFIEVRVVGAQAEWGCPGCGEEGVVSKWQGTLWDASSGKGAMH